MYLKSSKSCRAWCLNGVGLLSWQHGGESLLAGHKRERSELIAIDDGSAAMTPNIHVAAVRHIDSRTSTRNQRTLNL
jgi:hypothetical protein